MNNNCCNIFTQNHQVTFHKTEARNKKDKSLQFCYNMPLPHKINVLIITVIIYILCVQLWPTFYYKPLELVYDVCIRFLLQLHPKRVHHCQYLLNTNIFYLYGVKPGTMISIENTHMHTNFLYLETTLHPCLA